MGDELDLFFMYNNNGKMAKSDLSLIEDVKTVDYKVGEIERVDIYVKFVNDNQFYSFERFIKLDYNEKDILDIIKKTISVNVRRFLVEDMIKKNPLLDESDFSEAIEKIMSIREDASKQILNKISYEKDNLKNEK